MPGRSGIRQTGHTLREEHYNERWVDHSKPDPRKIKGRLASNPGLRMEDLKGIGNLGVIKKYGSSLI